MNDFLILKGSVIDVEDFKDKYDLIKEKREGIMLAIAKSSKSNLVKNIKEIDDSEEDTSEEKGNEEDRKEKEDIEILKGLLLEKMIHAHSFVQKTEMLKNHSP